MAAAVTHPIHYPQGAWWRHQTDTFSALLAICAGNSPVTGEFPAQKPVRRSFAVFLDLRLNKRWSKQWWSWWFETPLRSLLRHCNDTKLRWFSAICLPIFLRVYSLARGQVLLKWPRRALALWQSNDCPSASKATLMNMDKYFMWIHYERLHNHNKAKYNKTVCIFLGIYCTWLSQISKQSMEYGLMLHCFYAKVNGHEDVTKWKYFPRYWPFVRGIHRSRWIPRTKASDAELWCLLWSALELTIE